MKGFKELQVWRKAHEMTIAVYVATKNFPSDERYGLTSQLRRSASSIGSNIAEGCGRRSDGEMARFLQIARGSASEVEYQVFLARDLQYLREEEFRKLSFQADELQRMLTALIQRFRPAEDRKSV
ncbi:MAG TPA: four helix bundle protein [Terriglobales bacterium]|nr:four helix bundle protein [Terriglobales bacterium]